MKIRDYWLRRPFTVASTGSWSKLVHLRTSRNCHPMNFPANSSQSTQWRSWAIRSEFEEKAMIACFRLIGRFQLAQVLERTGTRKKRKEQTKNIAVMPCGLAKREKSKK